MNEFLVLFSLAFIVYIALQLLASFLFRWHSRFLFVCFLVVLSVVLSRLIIKGCVYL